MAALPFLAHPASVPTWYAAGVTIAAWIVYDTTRTNTPLPTALRWVLPILAVIFSFIPAATLRPPVASATYRDPLVLDANGNRIGVLADVDDVRATIDTAAPTLLLGLKAPWRRTFTHDVARDTVVAGQAVSAGQTMALAPLGVDRSQGDALTSAFAAPRSIATPLRVGRR